ncbi:hypothetical protein ONZ45_g19055 [Pleurotus djamor]|nr:hypothetical protein ONZ45_g19055 [Pleurotus djamor]
MAASAQIPGAVESAMRLKVRSAFASQLREACPNSDGITFLDLQLTSNLQPSELVIVNDSWKHRHHVAMKEQDGGNGETHFSIQIVSDAFKGKSTMQRHRMIYSLLSEEFAQGLHALSLNTKVPEEVNSA